MSEPQTGGGGGGGPLPPPPQHQMVSVAPSQAVRLQQVLTTRGGQQFTLVNVPGLTQMMPAGSTTLQQAGVARILNIAPSQRVSVVGRPAALPANGVPDGVAGRTVSLVAIGQHHPAAAALVGSLSTPPPPAQRQALLVRAPAGAGIPAASNAAGSPSRKRPRESPGRPAPSEEVAALRRTCGEHRAARADKARLNYAEKAAEAIFLQAGGNLVNYLDWRQGPFSPQFLHLFRVHRLDPSDDDEDLTPLLKRARVSVPPSPSITNTTGSTTPATPNMSAAISSADLQQTPPEVGNSVVPRVSPADRRAPPASPTKRAGVPRDPAGGGGGSTPGGQQDQMAEKARQEAHVLQRVSELQREGLWSERRLPKCQEPARTKAHWDYLVEEMVWLAADFAQERKWKKAAAKKCARCVQKYFQEKAIQAQKAEKGQELRLKKIASFAAKEIKTFWANVEKLVEFKQQTRLEEKRKQALDQHLSFIVDQTEKYSTWLAASMNKGPNSTAPSLQSSRRSSPSPRTRQQHYTSDEEFEPREGSTDDEETIAVAEAEEETQWGGGGAGERDELEMLREEGLAPLEDLELLRNLPEDYYLLHDRNNTTSPSSVHQDGDSSHDDEFVVASDDKGATDDEETIQEEEDKERNVDHGKEIAELEAENELSIEELRAKYSVALTPVEDDPPSRSEDSSEDEDDEADEQSDSGSEGGDVSGGTSNNAAGLSLEALLDNTSESKNEEEERNEITDVAALAESIQPTGNTLSSTSVATKIPFLLKHTLREYQHVGLDWLVTMFDRKLNGILADEMGLGKTIQTIALLAHLACDKCSWGPHLIVVPTSVMLNWEMEFKKWCPAFKILTYYGTQKERKMKRTGWTKPNAFHVCITSYKLVIQDHQSFRRKKWKYLILDEAQNIKNFKSQRWQLLLNFQTQRRLLLTGTPLQNNLMELWSLMHFLMPSVFQSHREFKEWFSNPVTGMIEGNAEYNENLIKRLHKVLRPFLLRRLKTEVEKQLPKKYEHVVMCRLSKRQRYLYDDFMSRAKTKETLASGNLLSVINVLMQLRKVCNHPNLFELRPTVSPFQMEGVVLRTASLVYSALDYHPFKHVDLKALNLVFSHLEYEVSAFAAHRVKRYYLGLRAMEEVESRPQPPAPPRSRINLRVQLSGKQQQRQLAAVIRTCKQRPPPRPLPPAGVSPTVPGASVPPAAPRGLPQERSAIQMVLTHPSGVRVLTASGQRLTVLSKSVGGTVTNTLTTTANRLAPSTVPTSHVSVRPVVRVSQLSLATAAPTVATTTTTTTTAAAATRTSPAVTQPVFTTTVLRNHALARPVAEHRQFLPQVKKELPDEPRSVFYLPELEEAQRERRRAQRALRSAVNRRRVEKSPLYGEDVVQVVRRALELPRHHGWAGGGHVACLHAACARPQHRHYWSCTDVLDHLVHTPQSRVDELRDLFARFVLWVPAVTAPPPQLRVPHPPPARLWAEQLAEACLRRELAPRAALLHPVASAMATQFPEPRLIQYDCGKLQVLDRLLRQLKGAHHRVLIFTQMTKMLDVLEAFLNYHGHIYLRLDGTTRVDQRQMLMERFNADPRIFCFILSTRSGGIGVNLTGADTVIFYDSDWNPTMDAQAQDRCHRIGQTRDVHIYRLVSEMTVEENILKKANQKRLLGDLAIEGGNFTTAYFKSSTIQDLFSVDVAEQDASRRMAEVLERSNERDRRQRDDAQLFPSSPPEDKVALGALESALAAAEDETDVQAARTAKAEAAAELAEFDESIPLEEGEGRPSSSCAEPELSRAEQEVQHLVDQLTPVEKYAMRFVEQTEAAWSAEQLAAAEAEIEQQKRDWEAGRLQALREEEQRQASADGEEDDVQMLTYSHVDAHNQVWVSDNTSEQMPMWCPPTPPQGDNDVYIDHTVGFLYEQATMSEAQLPPVYVKKEMKRRHEVLLPLVEREGRRPLKVRHKEECAVAPRSLFDRSPSAIAKMRREMKLQKCRGVFRSPGGPPLLKPTVTMDADASPDWSILEDWVLLQTLQVVLELPLNLSVVPPGHAPNWELVADLVSAVSRLARSPKQCCNRYECVIMPREEGRLLYESGPKRQKKTKGVYKLGPAGASLTKGRALRTAQLHSQDGNAGATAAAARRFEVMRLVAGRRAPTVKPCIPHPSVKNPKHAAVLSNDKIKFDCPMLPVEVIGLRNERLAQEKQKTVQAVTAGLSAEQQRLVVQRLQQQQLVAAAVAKAASQSPQQAAAVVVAVSSPSTSAQRPSTSLTVQEMVQGSQVRTVPGPQTVVSVGSLVSGQVQAAGQRLPTTTLVSSPQQAAAGTANKGVVTAGAGGKTLNPTQIHYYRQHALLKQQQQQSRLRDLKVIQAAQAGAGQKVSVAVTTMAVASVTSAQAQQQQQQQRTQILKQGAVGKQATIGRPMSDAEMSLLLKRQQQLAVAQQQKAQAQAQVATQAGLTPAQILAQAGLQVQQGSGGGTAQVATLVKTVGSSQSVTIPVASMTLPTVKSPSQQHQLRHLALHQHIMQRKLPAQKVAQLAQVAGKAGLPAQLIVQSPKALQGNVTMQQIHHLVKTVQQPHITHAPAGQVISHTMLAKAPQVSAATGRLIPAGTSQQGLKQIQVVAAAPGTRTMSNVTIDAAGRAQVTPASTLASALAGIKVSSAVSSSQQHTIISQVTAALRQSTQQSPVRIQTAPVGTPIVAVTMQQAPPPAPDQTQ